MAQYFQCCIESIRGRTQMFCRHFLPKLPFFNASIFDSSCRIVSKSLFMEKLLNFNEPLDVGLLDRVVAAMNGRPEDVVAAQKVLAQFKEHPQSWTRVDTILEYAQNPATKYFALQILEDLIKTRWNILPKEQREGIRNYIVTLIIKLSTTEELRKQQQLVLNKLNVTLVQILKREWPQNWQNFISEIVAASRKAESICENNMIILKLLSEEIFEFSRGEMVQAKIKELKQTLNKDFFLIYQLCDFVMNNATKDSLLAATLDTLLRYLTWIPLGYIFETNLIEMLIRKFFPMPNLRNLALRCLVEIVGLEVGDSHNQHFQVLYKLFMDHLVAIVPPQTNMIDAWQHGNDQDHDFIQQLSLFFTTLFRTHLQALEQNVQLHPFIVAGHFYLVAISHIPDVELFKITLEYWNALASSLYYEAPVQPLLLRPTETPRRSLYAEVLSQVRHVMISRMAKPEEVLITEDEVSGEITRQWLKDTDNIALYKQMRETLVFLTHLDYDDTQTIMLQKLNAQTDSSHFNWSELNTLCWAIGAIAGTQTEEMEKKFLVTVIKTLLELCEMTRGKDNKAVIASDIMFIVGQYPRFLRAHWRFLKTVVNKLFEFMHESYPGVQDMACDTFLKIARKCKRKFVVVQPGETRMFVEEIIDNIAGIICDLKDSQIQTFYEAVGHMISSHHDANVKQDLIARLMFLPNQTWAEIMKQAKMDIHFLKDPVTIKKIVNILMTNMRACSSLNHPFISQLGRIYLDMLNVYKVYSEEISTLIAQQGPSAARTHYVKSMRSVKAETLKLIETWVDRAEHVDIIVRDILPPLLAAVLHDYRANIPDAREAEVLSLMAQIVYKCKEAITQEIPRILEAIFEPTLLMITKNFIDYPEVRYHFFNLLRAINRHCFRAFLVMQGPVFKFIIDSIVWAFKHPVRNISEMGLNIMMEFLDNIQVTLDLLESYYIKSK
jgi:exportin-1